VTSEEFCSPMIEVSPTRTRFVGRDGAAAGGPAGRPRFLGGMAGCVSSKIDDDALSGLE
jgi:hypothetical protein